MKQGITQVSRLLRYCCLLASLSLPAHSHLFLCDAGLVCPKCARLLSSSSHSATLACESESLKSNILFAQGTNYLAKIVE